MITTDVLVIGAGPVGLFQAFQLGLLGLAVDVVDALPEPGGQCTALYPDKPIYDIPGMPRCTGRELTAQLLQQCLPFLPVDPSTGQRQHLHLGQVINSLNITTTENNASEHRFHLSSKQGQSWAANALILAGGVGAFEPRDWPIPDAPANASLRNVHFHLTAEASAPWAAQHVVVVGGSDDALETVLKLTQAAPAQAPAHITLLHRRDQFQAQPELEASVRSLIAQGKVSLCVGMPKAAVTDGQNMLQSLVINSPSGHDITLPLGHLLIQLGLSPKLGAISDWGLAMSRKQISVNNATCATSADGIYAVGDMASYLGKQRLIVCGFHEATLAAHACLARLRPDIQAPLQYTTTSVLLQERLGIVMPSF